MTLNFIYLVGENTPSFNIIHYIVVKSWLVKNPSFEVWFWTNKEPLYSPWYYRLKEEFPSRFTVLDLTEEIKSIQDEYKGPFKQTRYIAHQADVLRLIIIRRYGGAYCDLDHVCLASFEDKFTGNKPVYALELSEDHHFEAIPNGLFYAPENSVWINRVLLLYKDYNPDSWNDTSIARPTEMYLENPDQIKILPAGFVDPVSWRYDDWHQFFMYNNTMNLSDCWAVHLSESITRDFLKLVDLRHIMTVDTNFTKVVRQFVCNYWDYINNCSMISNYE